MKLSKLEIQGFKSFAKKTEIVISEGVTAVIGPNGSGKSNISDAIRWALGEQSARALRGNRMEDVIFNGTAVRHPLSMCSVSLIFNNEDRYLSLDSNEVSITRRVYRSGDGEYLINGKECRLKDILDLFHDTGIGKDGYSVISQGGVDNILSNRTQDRREAIEEAVGVTRFRVRREDTIRKLAQTKKNIERLEDILNELKLRLSPLEKESIKAKEALTLQNDLRSLEINHFIRETDKIQQKLSSWQQLLEDYYSENNSNKAEDAQLIELIEKQEANLAQYEDTIALARNEQLRLLSSYENLQSSVKIEQEHIRSAESEITRLSEDLQEILREIKHNTEIVQAADDDSQENLQSLQGHLSVALQAYESICEAVSVAENELEALKSSMMNNLNELAKSRSDRSRLETMRETLTERNNTLENDISRCLLAKNSLEQEYGEANEDYQSKLTKAELFASDLKQIETERNAAEKRKNETSIRLQQIDRELMSKQSNYSILKDLVKKREGYQYSVKQLMQDAPKSPALSNAIVGVVAEMISVPAEYETAIGTALGGSLQYIIAYTGNDAKAIIEHVRKNQYGRVTVLPMDILKVNDRDTRLNYYLSKPGVIGIASNLIKCSENAKRAIDFLLGRTLIVRDIDCALRLRRDDKCFLQMVTVEGDVLQSGGLLSGGSKVKRNFDLISRERELSELTDSIQKLSAQRNDLSKELTAHEEDWKDKGAHLYLKQTEYNNSKIDIERVKDKLQIIERDITSQNDLLQKIEEECASNNDTLLNIEDQLKQISHEEQKMSSSDSDAKAEIIAKQKHVLGLRAERDRSLNDLTESKIKVAAAEKDALTKKREKQKLIADIEAYKKKAALIENEIENARALSLRSDKESERLNNEANQVSEEEKKERTKIEAIQESIQEIKEEISSSRHRRDELLIVNRDIIEKQSKLEMSIGKLKTQQEQLADMIWQNYELTYENALAFKFDASVSGIHEKINLIRNKLKELGTINPGSIQEYEEVHNRFEDLSKQLEDVSKASADLEHLIEKLTKTMEKTFKDGFDKIKTQFENVFEDLFGGGKAELRLKDPSDVLNSDIEIIAQPPGKKLQLLSLMSGGERALTAIALLFAMLRIKSPSFCVLDEIETSLDEENVNRFAAFLKQYGKSTQFIVITHRKGSMEAADSLYGVSMEEKGISSIVSAKWEEA